MNCIPHHFISLDKPVIEIKCFISNNVRSEEQQLIEELLGQLETPYNPNSQFSVGENIGESYKLKHKLKHKCFS